MEPFDLSRWTDDAVDDDLTASVRQEKSWTASSLARLAEFDSRKLYLGKGYPTMQAYCVDVLGFSDDEALKKLHVARTGREFPLLFAALSEARLHLTGARLLAPYLTAENAQELVRAASRRTCTEIDHMLKQRIVRLETMRSSSAPTPNGTCAPSPTEAAFMIPTYAARHEAQGSEEVAQPSSAPGGCDSPESIQVPEPKPEPAVWVALEKRAHDKLEHARALLSHRLPLGSASQVLERALDDLIAKEEKAKFAAAEKPRAPRASRRPRCIPAHVRRAVWKRDRGQCTFVGSDGHRCGSRKYLEFDHIDPVARGGKATVDRMRLRCRAHNQYEAERAFGAEFMRRKREDARARGHESGKTFCPQGAAPP